MTARRRRWLPVRLLVVTAPVVVRVGVPVVAVGAVVRATTTPTVRRAVVRRGGGRGGAARERLPQAVDDVRQRVAALPPHGRAREQLQERLPRGAVQRRRVRVRRHERGIEARGHWRLRGVRRREGEVKLQRLHDPQVWVRVKRDEHGGLRRRRRAAAAGPLGRRVGRHGRRRAQPHIRAQRQRAQPAHGLKQRRQVRLHGARGVGRVAAHGGRCACVARGL